MGRLTEYHNGVAVIRDKSKHKEAMERLAFYEDLEETLENTLKGYVTIKDFILMNAEWFKMMNTEPELADAMMITNEEVKKYKEWKKLEEQGLLLKMKHKIGDVVYYISTFDYVIEVRRISMITQKSDKSMKYRLYSEYGAYEVTEKELEKEYYSTLAEAEKALAEMEK